MTANERSAGQGGIAVLWRAGRPWAALPEHERCRFTRMRLHI
jgi:hypothetical protein